MTNWIMLLGAILFEVAASLSLKGALNQPLLYGVVAIGYLTAFALLSAVLRSGMALGVAYGIWAALGVALTAIMSALIFGESLTLLKTIGLALIIGGVLLVEIGAQAAAEHAQATP